MRCRKNANNPNVKAKTKYKDPKNGEAGAAIPFDVDIEGGGGPSNGNKSPPKKVPIRVYWRQGMQRAMKTEDNASLSVPIWVSLCLIAGKCPFHFLSTFQ